MILNAKKPPLSPERKAILNAAVMKPAGVQVLIFLECAEKAYDERLPAGG